MEAGQVGREVGEGSGIPHDEECPVEDQEVK